MDKEELIMNSLSKSVINSGACNTQKPKKNELLSLDDEVIPLFPFVSNFLDIIPRLIRHGLKHLHLHYTPICTLIKLKKSIFLLQNIKADSLHPTVTFMRVSLYLMTSL